MTEMEQRQVLLLRQEKDALMTALTNVVQRNEEENQRTRELLSKLMAEMRATKMAEQGVMEQGDIIQADFSGDDVLVKISDTDTTADYLSAKLLPGTGINFTPDPHSPGNQTITINAAVAAQWPWMCGFTLSGGNVTLGAGWVSVGRVPLAVAAKADEVVTDGDCWGLKVSYSTGTSAWIAEWVKETTKEAFIDGEETLMKFYYEFGLAAGVASIVNVGASGNWTIPSNMAFEG